MARYGTICVCVYVGAHAAFACSMLLLVCSRPLPLPGWLVAHTQVEFDMVDTDRGIQAANVTGVGGAPLDRSRMDYGDNE